MEKTNGQNLFLWETHGIHIGTGKDHVKHGIDDVEEVVKLAIKKKHPSITFIIHTPRLTRYRYNSERATDIKFIRGDRAYSEYAGIIETLKNKYEKTIKIKYGIELEWLGSDLGLQWSRSKIFQARNADFVIGSVHFSHEGIPYDGSQAEADELLKVRGSIEKYWDGYFLEMMEMIESTRDMIQVVGHFDLPKLYMPMPDPILKIETSNHFLAKRVRTLLELISEYNLALDVNISGYLKGCGIYPDQVILKRAKQLNIPVAVGTDTHRPEDYSKNYDKAIEYLSDAGYKQYVCFSNNIPAKKPLIDDEAENKKFDILNLGIEVLNQRFNDIKRKVIPNFSFGGEFRSLMNNYPNSTSLGNYNALRVRKGSKSLSIGTEPEIRNDFIEKGLYSHHLDKPGVLSIIFNTLASEEINVETALLNANSDGTGTAVLELNGDENMIKEAVDFIKGTADDKFLEVEYRENIAAPKFNNDKIYLLEVDGVDLPIPTSPQMIITEHNNSAGILLILLSGLAAYNINVNELQLGQRGNKGYAILGVEGKESDIKNVLNNLGPQYGEATYIKLGS